MEIDNDQAVKLFTRPMKYSDFLVRAQVFRSTISEVTVCMHLVNVSKALFENDTI